MLIYCNNIGEIHDVYTNSLDDPTLIEYDVTDGTFDGWSVAKICCYKVAVSPEGHITMMTPYVDSRLIFHIDQLGRQGDTNTSDIADNREGLIETFEATEENETEIAELRAATMELYELIEGGEE